MYRIEVPPQTQAKKIKGRAKLTLHGTFVVEGAQTVEDEEYEVTVKEERELPAEPVPEVAEAAEGSATAEPNGDVPLQDQAESGDGDGKKEEPPVPKEPEKKYEWVDVVKKRERTKRTDLTVISSGVPGLSADILQKRMDEETGMQSEMRNIIELDEKFYIKFAQFEQRQKEMDRNTMKTINVRTDQSKRKIVIRTPPEDAAQCFDVACENAMAKMGCTIGLFSPCLYLHKTENVADDVAKSRSVYDTMMSVYGTVIEVFLDARSPSSQKGMQHHVVRTSSTPTRCSTVTRLCRVGVLFPCQRSVSRISVVPAVSLDGSLPSAAPTWRCSMATWSGVEISTGSSWNRAVKIQDDQLQTDDQNS